MSANLTSIAICGSLILAAALVGEGSSAEPLGVTMMTNVAIDIPQSVKREHEAIHGVLVEATREPAPVGPAAKALAAVLHPHFVREEQIALPPLGALADLAAGRTPPDAGAVLAMSDSLKAELPRMLEEHKQIRAAVLELRRVANATGATKYVELADELAAHAQSEEEVFYPAAVVVGELLRARMRNK